MPGKVVDQVTNIDTESKTTVKNALIRLVNARAFRRKAVTLLTPNSTPFRAWFCMLGQSLEQPFQLARTDDFNSPFRLLS